MKKQVKKTASKSKASKAIDTEGTSRARQEVSKRLAECERIVKENDRFTTQVIENASRLATTVQNNQSEFLNFKTEIVERIILLEHAQVRLANVVDGESDSLIEQNQALLGELAEAKETINRVESQRQELEQLTYTLEDTIHSLQDELQNLSSVVLSSIDFVSGVDGPINI